MKCQATGKIIHRSKEGACIAAKKLKSCRLNVYPCGKCKGWHIGNSNSQFRIQQRFDQIFAQDRTRHA